MTNKDIFESVLKFLNVPYKESQDVEGGRDYLYFRDGKEFNPADPDHEGECILGFDTDTGENVSVEWFN